MRVDDRISDSEAACLQSLSDSVAAVETAGIGIGDSVAIFGQGSMGLECLQIARNSGAGLIVTVDVRDEACRSRASSAPITPSNARDDDPVAAIRDLTGGNGADVVFECAGGSPKQGLAGTRSLMQAIEAVRSGGKLVGVSWFGGPAGARRRPAARAQPAVTSSPTSARWPTWNTRSGWWPRAACGSSRRSPTSCTGLESVPEAFEITANKGKYQAINPAQVVLCH